VIAGGRLGSLLRRPNCSSARQPSHTLRRSTALTATITVEALMNIAPTAGESRMPQAYATPAASGRATAL
jgi:hypothetical protein